MRAFRLFALILLGASLLMQGPANAGTTRSPTAATSTSCAEMKTSEDAPVGKHDKACCADMSCCLLGMSCFAPLAGSDLSGAFVPIAVGDAHYGRLERDGISAAAHGPEPPPPEFHS